MTKKQGGKIACGQCHKFFKEDELILDAENNRYLCDGCYEPRDNDCEPDNKCRDCGELIADCECDKDDIEEEKANPVRAVRGEARIKPESRTERARPIKEKNKKSLISW